MMTFAITLCPGQETLLFHSLQLSPFQLLTAHTGGSLRAGASSIHNRKKGLVVDTQIPRDGIGSDHTEKPAQIHGRLDQKRCEGASRIAAQWYLSLSWASDPVLVGEIPMNEHGLKSHAIFKTGRFYLAHAGISRDLGLRILAQMVVCGTSCGITHTLCDHTNTATLRTNNIRKQKEISLKLYFLLTMP